MFQPALRHGGPTHRYLSGILAWRRGLLSALWHGDPFHRYFRGIPAWRSVLLTGLEPVFVRCFNRPFGTATLPTGTSGASPRGKASPNRSQTGLFPMLWPVLRHGDLAHKPLRGILAWRRWLLDGLRHGDLAYRCSGASSRSHCELVHRIVAEMGFVKFTWHEPLLIIK